MPGITGQLHADTAHVPAIGGLRLKKAYNEEFMPEGVTVHSLQITPAMKKSLLKEGQPIAENKPE